MSVTTFTLRLEESADAPAIDKLVWSVFGPGMTARAAYVLRENVEHEPSLSFVAHVDDELIGTVRLTPIMIGNEQVMMLGPLAVNPVHKNNGVGKQLMQSAMDAAAKAAKTGAAKAVFLVGDEPYYAPFGFKRAGAGAIKLPRPADPSRILVCKFDEDLEIAGTARSIAEVRG